MFDQNMKEANMGEVDICDVDPDTLKQMLEFIYTGQVPFTCFRNFQKQFLLDRLKIKPTLLSFSTLLTNMDSTTW